jgi:AcrR family transcriptional regulator
LQNPKGYLCQRRAKLNNKRKKEKVFILEIMVTISKGEATRKSIVEKARIIFNEKGIGITLEMIAAEMGISKSRISNHFPTKDGLFIAILREYETELAVVVGEQTAKGFQESLQAYADGLSEIMDIQFKYRCGIIYLNMLSPSQHELKMHTRENYTRTLQIIRARMQRMADLGIIDPGIFEEMNWQGFVFTYVNLLTQWVIHYDMYDSDLSYQQAKAKYLHGIIHHIYQPYLTTSGKQELAQLKIPLAN